VLRSRSERTTSIRERTRADHRETLIKLIPADLGMSVFESDGRLN